MKKTYLLAALFASIAFLAFQNRATAQYRKPERKPHFVVAADPLEWAAGRANLCASGLIVKKVALCGGLNFHAGEAIMGQYLVQSAQIGWGSEARLYPFGGPSQATAFFVPKTGGCPGFSSLWKKERSRPSPLAGFYVAPGFGQLLNELALTPQFDSPTPVYRYKIRQNSGTFAVGYDLHIWHFTLGGRWQTAIGKTRWSGPVDIFGDSLNRVNYPFKLNVANRFGLSVGVNF